jgi:voltage-gated potassium channel
VTLSTTGFGDIVPVTPTARLVNIVLISPVRVTFLIVLVGTTLEVLAERTRTSWRIKRWRSHVAGRTVIIGYGTKGRSVIRTLGQCGLPDEERRGAWPARAVRVALNIRRYGRHAGRARRLRCRPRWNRSSVRASALRAVPTPRSAAITH